MSTGGVHSGLFTLHFTLFAGSAKDNDWPLPSCQKGGKKPTGEFGDWHVLLRFAVDNDIISVRHQGKIFTMTDEYSEGSSGEEPVVIPALGRIPRPLKGRHATVVMRSHYHWQLNEPFRFDVHLDQLEGSVVGSTEAMLSDVTLGCEGYTAYGWYMGDTSIMVGGVPYSIGRQLRFILMPYIGPQCIMCLDPVYAQGYTCAECGGVEYCSRECQLAHMNGGHGLLCPTIARTYTQRSGKITTEMDDGSQLVAWWRCLEDACYSILVDYRNPIGQAVEFFLCTLKPAQEEGIRYRFIVEEGSKPQTVSPETFVDFSCTVFRAVSENAISEGCASLAAACLNYLFVYSCHTEVIVESHVLYYYSCLCEDMEGTIHSLEEYVAYARPMHELGVALIEFALKSPTSHLFWQRMKMVKSVFINLYNINTSCQGSENSELVRAIPGQQRETLHLLAKVFLIMASRAPENEVQFMLKQAEKCLRDCLPEREECSEPVESAVGVRLPGGDKYDDSQGFTMMDDTMEEMDPSNLAALYYRLSVLLLLYGDSRKTREAEALKAQGDALIARKRQLKEQTAEGAHTPSLPSAVEEVKVQEE